MKKSTRALTGLILIDAFLVAGAAWMVFQTRTGAWNAPDPALTINLITTYAGATIGVITALLLMVFVVQKRRGD